MKVIFTWNYKNR